MGGSFRPFDRQAWRPTVHVRQPSSIFLPLSLSHRLGMGNRAINIRTTQAQAGKDSRPVTAPFLVGRLESPFPQFSIASGAKVTSCLVKNHRRQGCQMAKFDPFLSLDWAGMEEGGAIQGKEGINFCSVV